MGENPAMGAKDSLICYADAGTDVGRVLGEHRGLDRAATDALVGRLFADCSVEPAADGTLGDDANPGPESVYAAVWPGASVVCTSRVALDRPSELAAPFLAEGAGRTVAVHAMHSVVDWFAYALWSPDGRLLRSLSVGADVEVMEDLGERLPFEQPYWAGEHPATDDGDYPLPFHPLELGEAALDHLVGVVFEGHPGPGRPDPVDPFDVPLAGYRLRRRRGLFRRR